MKILRGIRRVHGSFLQETKTKEETCLHGNVWEITGTADAVCRKEKVFQVPGKAWMLR